MFKVTRSSKNRGPTVLTPSPVLSLRHTLPSLWYLGPDFIILLPNPG